MHQGKLIVVLVVYCVGILLTVEARTTRGTVGCDGVLGSGLVKDKCGVCGGDNTVCDVFSGEYTEANMAIGYHKAFKIPKGAMYINITEMAKSRNYLALQDSSSVTHINGNWRIDLPGNFTVGGALFEYKRDARAKVGEQFLAMGPTTEDLYVVLIYQTSNPGIHYEWVIRKPADEQQADSATAAEETEQTSSQRQTSQVRQPTFSKDRPVSVNPIRGTQLPERQGLSRQQTSSPDTTPNTKTNNGRNNNRRGNGRNNNRRGHNNRQTGTSNTRQPVVSDTPVRTSTPGSGGTAPRTSITTSTTYYNRQGGLGQTSALSQTQTGVAFVNEENTGTNPQNPREGAPDQNIQGTDRQDPAEKTASRSPVNTRQDPESPNHGTGSNVDPAPLQGSQSARTPQTAGQGAQTGGSAQTSQGATFNRNPQNSGQGTTFARNPQNPVQGTSFRGNPQTPDRGMNPQNPSNFNPVNPIRPGSQFRTGSSQSFETGGRGGGGQPSVVSPYTPGIYRPPYGSQPRYPLTQGATQSRTVPQTQGQTGGGQSPIPTGFNPAVNPVQGNPQPPPQGASFNRQQPYSGRPIGGQPYSGQPLGGQPLSGQSYSGQPLGGQSYSGQPLGGQSYSGQPIARQPISGQPIAGQPINGQPLAGHPLARQPIPGQPLGGQQQIGGQPRPRQPLGGQPLDGQQQIGGQPRPRQPLGGQPLGGQQQIGGQPRPRQPLGGQPLGGRPNQGQPLNRQPIGGQPIPGQPLVPRQPIPGQPLVPGQTQGVGNPPYSGLYRPQYPGVGVGAGGGTTGAGGQFAGYNPQQGGHVQGGSGQGQGQGVGGQFAGYNPQPRGHVQGGSGQSQGGPVQGGPITQYSGGQYPGGGLPDSVSVPDQSGRPTVLNPYTSVGAKLKENTRGQPKGSSNPQGYQPLTGPSVPGVVGYDNQDPTQQQLPNVPVPGANDGNRLSNRLQYRWFDSGQTDCSVTCGGGLQQSIVQCVQEGSYTAVEESLCDSNFRPNPRPRTCNQDPCPPVWDGGEWGECSRTCGQGRQLRSVVCKQTYSQTLTTTVASDRCDQSTKPNNVQDCKVQSCASWKAGEWGECSARCGEGRKSRPVKCVDERSEELAEELCEGLPKPTTTDSCDMGQCVAKWFADDWSELCSSECDGGERARDVVCATEGYGAILEDGQCSTDQKPRDTKMCNNMPCGAKWMATMWGQCSAECGEGTQTREVMCVSATEPFTILPAENCPMGDKPELTQTCVLKDCEGKWFKSDWSECSKTCGGGHRTRDTKCLDQSLEPSNTCSIDDRPEERQSCNIQQCSLAPPPDDNCRDKFSYCTVVAQARLCTYSYYKTSCCFSCHGRQED